MSFRKREKRKPVADINVVPYIDVMLVLLVVFMVTAPMIMQGVEVDLPKVNSSPVDSKDEEPLIVSIKADGSLYLNIGKQDQALALEALQENVAKILQSKPRTHVLVWGDKKVPYGEVVTLMSHLQTAGVPNVGLVTEAP